MYDKMTWQQYIFIYEVNYKNNIKRSDTYKNRNCTSVSNSKNH